MLCPTFLLVVYFEVQHVISKNWITIIINDRKLNVTQIFKRMENLFLLTRTVPALSGKVFIIITYDAVEYALAPSASKPRIINERLVKRL